MTDNCQKTILLVEDELIIALTEKQQLENAGYRVIQAFNGTEAVDIVRKEADRIDLILMDIDLGSGMDGTATTAEIQNYQSIPVIFVSSHAEKEIVKKTEGITSYGYVVKNSNFTILDASIKMAFRLHETHNNLLRSEQHLTRSELQYRLLFTEMREGFALHEIICDKEGKPIDYRYLDINPAFEKMTGLRKSDVVGKTVLALMPNTEQVWIERFGRVALTGESEVFENYAAELDRYYHVVAYCPTHGQFAVLANDITERKQTIAALTESEHKFRYLVHDMQVGVILQGPKAEILMCNPKALELLGLTEGQILGTTSFDPSWNVIHEDGTPFPGVEHPVPQAIATGKPIHNIIMGVYRPLTGDRVWLSVDAEPNLTQEGVVMQVVCTFVDITQRKTAEDSVQNLLHEKELILKEVHHRIKNNMNTIFGLLTLQANAQTNNETRAILLESACRVQSMMVLYDKLYRSEHSGYISLKDYLPALSEQILEIFPHRRKVTIETDIQDIEMPTKTLSTLGIIVNELMTNAMKYAFNDRTNGHISITASKKDATVTIQFSDNGIGLPEDFSVENSKGFGMQLILGLARQIGGTIEIDRDQGTRYTITMEAANG